MALSAALLAGAIAWGVVEQVHPAFDVPKEYHIANLGAPVEKWVAYRAAANRVDGMNAMLDLAILGGLVAAALALAGGTARRPASRLAIAAPLGALGGAAGGLIGSVVHVTWLLTAAQPDVIHTAGQQVAALAALGLGVGLAFGCAQRAVRTALPAGLLAGTLAGTVYPIAVSLLLPATGTESLIPGDRPSRLLYIGVTAALLGLIVPIARKPQQADSPPAAEPLA
jgi:hypothetical protein